MISILQHCCKSNIVFSVHQCPSRRKLVCRFVWFASSVRWSGFPWTVSSFLTSVEVHLLQGTSKRSKDGETEKTNIWGKWDILPSQVTSLSADELTWSQAFQDVGNSWHLFIIIKLVVQINTSSIFGDTKQQPQFQISSCHINLMSSIIFICFYNNDRIKTLFQFSLKDTFKLWGLQNVTSLVWSRSSSLCCVCHLWGYFHQTPHCNTGTFGKISSVRRVCPPWQTNFSSFTML